MSMSSSSKEKKSDPKIGLGTSATKKECSTRRVLNRRGKRVVPKVLIAEPFAATKEPVEAEDDDDVLGADREGFTNAAGKTETSAPLSTRKSRPDSSSLRDMAPGPEEMEEMEGGDELMPGATAARRDRFPAEELS